MVSLYGLEDLGLGAQSLRFRFKVKGVGFKE